MRLECYGETRPKAGRGFNEDAYLIHEGEIPFAALCDGDGNAGEAVGSLLTQFQNLFKETSLARILKDSTWCKWIKLLDASLPKGTRSTFLALAVVGNQIVGTYAGDSRAFLVNNGSCTIIAGEANTPCLGTGKAVSTPFRVNLKNRNIILLMSYGAWTPLEPNTIQSIAAGAMLDRFKDLPQMILSEAEHTGRLDDMTAIALRIL